MHRTIKLPNECSVGRISVYPKNWKTRSKKELENDIARGRDWYIHYRFDDPNYPKPKKVIIKHTINKWKTLKERRGFITNTINTEIRDLENGWNPITKKFERIINFEYEIDPRSTILDAFNAAVDRLVITDKYKKDFKYILNYTGKAIRKLGMSNLQIQEVKRRHMVMILKTIGQLKEVKWTANNFNHYRKHYSTIFTELIECEAIEYHPVRDIKKKSTTHKIKELLTTEERLKINAYLSEVAPEFLRFIKIFYHSGRRTTEMIRVQRKDVYLERQEFKILQLKGTRKTEMLVPIKNIALPYWLEATKGAKPEDYIFSSGLKPGPKQIDARQITKRWRLWVKGNTKKNVGLGIQKDFYSLKHSNLDEISGLIGLQTASSAAGHTSTRTTEIYAVNEKKRRMEAIKKIDNKFV